MVLTVSCSLRNIKIFYHVVPGKHIRNINRFYHVVPGKHVPCVSLEVLHLTQELMLIQGFWKRELPPVLVNVDFSWILFGLRAFVNLYLHLPCFQSPAASASVC